MRRLIALVTAAGLLPIIALTGAFGVATLRAERAAVRNAADSGARFIATLAAVRLADGMREVDMIAQSPAFDGPFDAARFRKLGMRLRDSSENWRFLSVADPNGRRILDLPEAMGGGLGPVIDMASLKQAVATRKPVVGNVVAGPSGRFAFAVRAPVIRDGEIRYIVSAVIPADVASRLLSVRKLPEGWRAGIIDGAGTIAGSSLTSAGFIGAPASRAGRLAKQAGKPGFYNVTRSDGSEGLVAWQPIEGTTWSAHVSAPVAGYVAASQNAWTLLFVIMVVGVALLAFIVWLLLHELRAFRRRETALVQGQRLEALGRLTGGVAHDFNNLLQPVLGGLDLLARRVGNDEKARRHIALALASAERARALVARLLAFARQQPLANAPVDVAEMIGGIADLIERSVGPTAKLAVSLPADLPLVQADASQLELAVLNLAINARDAMPDGGTVSITAKPMTVTKAQDLAGGDYVAITVADTGIGMDEATIRQAIDPFFTTKSADKGTGLGLSMVHGFAAQSGGAFRLDSKPGAGTRATIVMPLARVQARKVKEVERKPSGSNARILLVDDDVQVRRSIAELLRECGHDVREAASVDEALNMLSTGLAVDLVITDFLMPGRNGGELCRELEQRWPGIPILMITGHETRIGPETDHIPRLLKPFRADEILAKIATLLPGAAPTEPA